MRNVRKFRRNLYQARCKVDGINVVAYGKTAIQAYENMIMKKQELLTTKEVNITSNMTFADWFNYWYRTYKAKTLAPKSLQSISSCYKNHISERFRSLPIGRIKALDIERELGKIEKSRTCKYTQTVISGCLRKAYKLELIPKPVYEFIDVPAHIGKKGEALTLEEQKLFLERIRGNKYENYFLFCLYTGSRRSEALSVKLSHINYAENCLTIPGTKTKKSFRVIPLFPNLRELLLTMTLSDERIFPYSPYTVSHVFSLLVPGNHTLKDLRHTFSTRCYESGIPMKVIQEWLGHTTYKLTADTYTHVLSDFSKEFTQAVDFKV